MEFELRVGSVSVRGAVTYDNRYEVERWLTRPRLDVALLQNRARQSAEFRWQGRRCVWYFSGGEEGCVQRRGVAVAINNESANSTRGARAVNRRIARLELKGVVPICLITAYAPTADNDD